MKLVMNLLRYIGIIIYYLPLEHISNMPITSSTSLTAVNFIKSIIFRFGVPHNSITDNGTNFTAVEFQNFCEELGIKINYASVAHPQSNGQVEKANDLVCGGIKKRSSHHSSKTQTTGSKNSLRYYGSCTTPNTATHY